MIAYKGTDSKMQCRGFQYEVGKEYQIAGATVCCKNGFHACATIAQTFNYYPPVNGSRYFRVEVLGDIDRSGDKLCTNRIRIIKEVFVTEKDCLKVVKRNGMAIQYLTNEQRSPEVCLEAVRQNGWAIQRLTNEQRSPEVCLEAVKQMGWAIYYLTDEQRSPEVCLEAVRHDGLVIRYLTNEQRSPEVCLEAVRQDEMAIEYLTNKQREAMIKAIKGDEK